MPKKKFVENVRNLTTVELHYDRDVEVDLPRSLSMQPRIHAQTDPSGRQVRPRLVFLKESRKPRTKRVKIRLLRGAAKVPDTPEEWLEFIAFTEDRNPKHSGFATAWIVNKRGSEGKENKHIGEDCL